MSNEIVKKDENLFVANADALDLQDELAGLSIKFDKIKVPSGGSLAFEVPGENPDEPEFQKEFKAVILYQHPMLSYYKEKYTGGNEAPDCSSLHGLNGVEKETGCVQSCKDCPFAKFGSGENGGKACKTRRRLFILRENEMFPSIFSVPTSSLNDYSSYVFSLIKKGRKLNQVVTKFSLKKATSGTGITYSKVVLACDRDLSDAEKENIAKMTEQVKSVAHTITEQVESEE